MVGAVSDSKSKASEIQESKRPTNAEPLAKRDPAKKPLVPVTRCGILIIQGREPQGVPGKKPIQSRGKSQ